MTASCLAKRYLHGNAIDQIFAQENVGETGADEVYWLLEDNLDSVRDVIDNEGEVINRIDYDAFGNILSIVDPSDDDQQTDLLTSVTFTGQMWDADLGLYYYKARWYDPVTMTFISRDPLRFDAGDANLYRYVGNSPVNWTDPSGATTFGPGVGAGGFVPVWWVIPITIHLQCSGEFNIGVGPDGWTIDPSVTAGFGLGVGWGCSIGPQINCTSAASAQDVHGLGSELVVCTRILTYSRLWLGHPNLTENTGHQLSGPGSILGVAQDITYTFTLSGCIRWVKSWFTGAPPNGRVYSH